MIGGGAAGLMAAYAAASNGAEVLLVEKNEKLGKKIYITGKGRCNLTNNCPPNEFLQNVVRGGKFLTGSIYRFSSADTMKFMEEHGLDLKTERGNRVFPVSDHASDVTKTLERACREVGVKIKLNCEVRKIVVENSITRGVVLSTEKILADRVVVATGGLSYPSTGSTGDGLRFAEETGHTIMPCVPSLVGLEAKGVTAAQGISLRNCVLTACRKGKIIFSEFGELLFTHYGISGPLVLSLSANINRIPIQELSLAIDFKPGLNNRLLDARLLRDFSERSNEQMKNVMRGLLPLGLVELVLKLAQVSEEKRANSITREERMRLVKVLKEFPVKPVSLRGFSEAVVTSGGVDLKEINPKTMQSKLVDGLYFCGEVLDCDAYTGGFNLQIAFSTGYIAGLHAAN